MSGERFGKDGRDFVSKKPLTAIEGPNHATTLPQSSKNVKSDMCTYAACVDADWGDDVPDEHKKWIQDVYDKG